MKVTNEKQTFALDGHIISANFTEEKNPVAFHNILNILISSFAKQTKNYSADSLEITGEMGDNRTDKSSPCTLTTECSDS